MIVVPLDPPPIIASRHGRTVYESAMDAVRKEKCMCFHCANMKPWSDDHCQLAKKLFKICVEHGMAMMITRCPDWKDPRPD